MESPCPASPQLPHTISEVQRCCVPDFLTPEAPHRVRDIHADWDTLVTKIDVGQEIRHLKGLKDGAQGRGLIVTFAD
jgi:hypothetical protein